ncbi:MAG: OadG family protein [Gammaproteobacteria bacterium]|nr:OadG family protein [Gammaproteobacteria bacterium]
MQLGLELALMGMLTVFSFLIILIFLTTLMSKTISAIEEKTADPIAVTPSVPGATKKIPDEVLKTVITNAIKQHRSNTPQQRKEV